MALASFKKIQLIAIAKHKDKILEILQNAGVFETVEKEEEASTITTNQTKDLQKAELNYANTEFAIKLLTQYETAKKGFSQPPTYTVDEVNKKVKAFNHAEVTEKCSKIEEDMTNAKNAIASAKAKADILKPWKNLKVDLSNLKGTEHAAIILSKIKTNSLGGAIEDIHNLSELISSEVVGEMGSDTFFMIVFTRELEKEIRSVLVKHKAVDAEIREDSETVKHHLDELKSQIEENEKVLESSKKKLQKLADQLDNLKIANDYFAWQKEKAQSALKLINTDYSFYTVGWIPAHNLEPLKEAIEKETNEHEIIEMTPEEGENPPVLLKNNKFMEPFESVTKVYGLPRHDEMDPTPFLSAYFIIFFAMCLTDAGYGIIMFIAMLLIRKKIKLDPSTLKLVNLLMYGGIITFFMGIIFGGWFGLTPDQVPEYLTTTDADGDPVFIFQSINALKSPVTVLIISLAFGFVQVLTGVYMKLIHALKTKDVKEALLDTGTWAFMLTAIGFAILTAAGVLPEYLKTFSTYLVYAGALILVVTQGRSSKNIIMKGVSGVLSLYDLVGYLSDILSYSRILALGLATAIIGLAVNIVAGLVMGLPYVGWLIATVVFIGGHIFNLLLNALGSFIHSGRLQFVEFFTKFMEGGGRDFKPLSKKSKYLFLKS